MQPPISRTLRVLAWCLIIFPIVLRVEQFCIFRSLWLDELYLADNVVHRSWDQLLFEPLDHFQAAPPGYLALEKLSVTIFGNGERSLRLVSLIAGVVSTALFLVLAQRTLGGGAGVFAVVFFAVLGPLVYYSNEAKPYELDVAVSLAIALAVIALSNHPTEERAGLAAVVGSLGVLCSFPAIFTLAGIGGAALLSARRESRRLILWGIGPGILVFGLENLLLMRSLHDPATRAHLIEYWSSQHAFPPRWPLGWLVKSLLDICRSPAAMWLKYPAVALCGMAVGVAAAMWRRSKLLQILMPVPLLLIAAAFRQYPFADRLMLFFTPFLLLILAAGLNALWTNWPAKIVAICIGVLTLGPTARLTLAYFFVPAGREESLQTYRWVEAHWQPGDSLYLSHHAQISYDYYHARAGLAVEASRLSIEPQIANDPAPVFADVKRFAGAGRVWVVQVHTDEGPLDEKKLTLDAMDMVGTRADQHLEQGAGAWLFICPSPDTAH